jgi:hypothetical protein
MIGIGFTKKGKRKGGGHALPHKPFGFAQGETHTKTTMVKHNGGTGL